MAKTYRFLLIAAVSLVLLATPVRAAQCTHSTQTATVGLPEAILFVTQLPIPADFATIGSTFANHLADAYLAGRGGDLWALYPDGRLCNLTREGGYGEAGVFQGEDSISVRDPHVHWSGDKALFSMVVGNTDVQYVWGEYYWQIYEITGLARGTPLAIAKVPGQPTDTNNVTPIYSPDGRILFTSDRPRDGRRHLYPQHDEYESTATNTGLWSLDPATGDLHILNHAPSGVFTPMVDSFGRVVFTRWDHLQRDQQADAPGNPYGNFDWASEEPGAPLLPPSEIFPEPRIYVEGSNVNPLRINHFFPWQIHPDGTEEETLNHVGRHELHEYFDRSFNDDPELEEFIDSISGRFNPNSITNFFQIAEDPQNPGTYFGVDAPEFFTHASGMVASLTLPPGQNPDQVAVSYLTHPDTRETVDDGAIPPATHSGHYRDPLPLSDGRLIAAHTAETRAIGNEGTRSHPDPRYDFQLKLLGPAGSHLAAGSSLTGGIVRQIEYWDPDVRVFYTGPMWELQPRAIRARPQPPVLSSNLAGPEAQVFTQEGVDEATFRAFMRLRGLALAVSRDVTTRDALDLQQPFNLRVPGGVIADTGSGQVYDVSHLQFFQADQVRGIGGTSDPDPGRRPLARLMHDPAVENPPTAGPAASVEVALDGSTAAFVPTRRAMSWQLTDGAGEPVIRERYWITFQPGEIRVCTSCHGLSTEDQLGRGAPTNSPEALRQLLQFWKAEFGVLFVDDFEEGNRDAWSQSVP